MAFFSVIVPLYNKENYVSRTLDSILAQTFGDFEVVIVDDCSTDASLSIARKYESAQVRIVCHQTNKGLSASRNTGIRHSESEFVTFLDADDTWKPFFLSEVFKMISAFPEASVFGTAYDESYQGGIAVPVKKNISVAEGTMTIIDDFFSAASNQPIYCYSTVAFKKSVFEDVGWFDEGISLGEDVDFNIRVHLKHTLAYYNRSCADYVIFSENQITNSDIANKTVTDFGKYEPLSANRPSLKLYMDVNRYMLAMQYKLAGIDREFKKQVSGIDLSNLTSAQKFLLRAPNFVVKGVRKVKAMLLSKGVRLATFKG